MLPHFYRLQTKFGASIGGSRGGREGRTPPPWASKFFRFHAVFGKIWRVHAPPGGFTPPPRENPGSATGKVIFLHQFVILFTGGRGVPARGCTCPGGCTCWGVYLPGGGCVPAGGCTCPGGCTCQRGGVPAQGDVPAGGCTCLGDVPARGVYLPGGVPARGGVPAWGVYLPGGCTCLGGTCQGGVPGKYTPPPPHTHLLHPVMVNQWAVRILLECILVKNVILLL